MVASVGAFAVVALATGALTLSRRQHDAAALVDHTLAALVSVDRLDADLATAASEGRGYAVDHADDSEQRFEAAANASARDLAELRARLAGDPRQQRRLERLGELIPARLGVLRTTIAAITDSRPADANALSRNHPGRWLADQIQGIVAEIKAEEQRLLSEANSAVEAAISRVLWSMILATAVAAACGVAVALLLMARARDARQAARLRDSEERFRSTFEQAAVGIAHVGLDGVWLRVNGRICAMLGYSETELRSLTFQDITHPDDLEADLSPVTSLLAEERSTHSMEKRCLRKNGEIIWASLTVSALRDASGQIQHFIFVVEDSTARRQAEATLLQANETLETCVADRTAALAALEARQRSYLQHFDHGITAMRVGADARLRYEAINDLARHLLGLPADSIGREPSEVLPPDVLALAEAPLRRCIDTGEPVRYRQTRTVDGVVRDLDFLTTPVRESGGARDGGRSPGRISLLLISVRDLTHEAQVEARLRQVQRLEAVGQLTAGIAHDFNNLLQAISGALEVLGDAPALDTDARDCIGIAQGAAQRGAGLVHRLLAFSRKQVLQPAQLQPGRVLDDMIRLLVRTLDGRITIRHEVADDVWPIAADREQLDNCLLNLALNARDAMAGSGTLVLSAANAAAAVAAEAGMPWGDYVRLSVTDTGVGMSAETLARAVEPFFTTKPIGKGTGLGLSMVQGFARQSGGDISIVSALGTGTTVSLWLPRAAATPKAPVIEPGSSHSRGAVVVVDDEPGVRHLIVRVLGRNGFTVAEYAHGQAALDALDLGLPCDLLLTDQSMAGITGVELIERATEARPELRTMIITGFDRVSGLDRLRGHITVLPKPFTAEDLVRRVEALLGLASRPPISVLPHHPSESPRAFPEDGNAACAAGMNVLAFRSG